MLFSVYTSNSGVIKCSRIPTVASAIIFIMNNLVLGTIAVNKQMLDHLKTSSSLHQLKPKVNSNTVNPTNQRRGLLPTSLSLNKMLKGESSATSLTPGDDRVFFPPYKFPFWGLPYGIHSKGGFFNPGLFPFVPGGPAFPPYDGIFGGPVGSNIGHFPGSGPTPFQGGTNGALVRGGYYPNGYSPNVYPSYPPQKPYKKKKYKKKCKTPCSTTTTTTTEAPTTTTAPTTTDAPTTTTNYNGYGYPNEYMDGYPPGNSYRSSYSGYGNDPPPSRYWPPRAPSYYHRYYTTEAPTTTAAPPNNPYAGGGYPPYPMIIQMPYVMPPPQPQFITPPLPSLYNYPYQQPMAFQHPYYGLNANQPPINLYNIPNQNPLPYLLQPPQFPYVPTANSYMSPMGYPSTSSTSTESTTTSTPPPTLASYTDTTTPTPDSTTTPNTTMQPPTTDDTTTQPPTIIYYIPQTQPPPYQYQTMSQPMSSPYQYQTTSRPMSPADTYTYNGAMEADNENGYSYWYATSPPPYTTPVPVVPYYISYGSDTSNQDWTYASDPSSSASTDISYYNSYGSNTSNQGQTFPHPAPSPRPMYTLADISNPTTTDTLAHSQFYEKHGNYNEENTQPHEVWIDSETTSTNKQDLQTSTSASVSYSASLGRS